MIMGIIILRKRYEISKYLSVLMITMGIIICTIISGSNVVCFLSPTKLFKKNSFNHFLFFLFLSIMQQSTANPNLAKENTDPSGEFSVFFWWSIGISLLTVSLFISARMGIYQEVLYKQYGKHPWEALYITVSAIDHIMLFVLYFIKISFSLLCNLATKLNLKKIASSTTAWIFVTLQ